MNIKALEKEGWAAEREYVRNDKNKTYGINMRKGEFVFLFLHGRTGIQ